MQCRQGTTPWRGAGVITQQSASALLAQLTQERLIEYNNDVVQILNRAGLEAMACECYERVQIELDKIRVKRQMR